MQNDIIRRGFERMLMRALCVLGLGCALILSGCNNNNTNQSAGESSMATDDTAKTTASDSKAAGKTTASAAATTAPAVCDPNDPAACGTAHWKGKTEAEWRATLTPEQYRIARQAGTERAFTGKYWNTKTKGTYTCAACGQELFRSEAKFDSGTGWPSYFEPIAADRVTEHTDRAHGMTRVEARCGQCDAHLGHVFPDGPEPTGLRYCMNSAVLNLIPDDNPNAE